MVKEIAILFMSNRFSQKIGKRVSIQYKNVEYTTIPINMRKITNPNTITKKLKEYDCVMLHSSDIDLIEKLKELKIKFLVMPLEYSDDKYQHLRFDDLYIKTHIKKFLGIIIKQKVYFVDEKQKVSEKEVTYDASSENNYCFTPKEAVDEEIKRLNIRINDHQYWIDYYTDILNKVKENCKDYL